MFFRAAGPSPRGDAGSGVLVSRISAEHVTEGNSRETLARMTGSSPPGDEARRRSWVLPVSGGEAAPVWQTPVMMVLR